ncbi:hypothetical protein SLS56_008182 [Neofusicoccum ribis]|uniref:Uncharacterized protein n=1 Tax=Neofusicoccum ribis TaxID=45134 RepID=A0ABR3SKV8_9PEZI
MSAKRWSSYDEDAYRLPSGMTRVGYDADSGKYTFRDGSGQEYTSASGSAYGKLEKYFSEILSELEEEEEESEKDKPKEKARPLPFLILGSVMSFKSKLGSRRGRKEGASMWGKMKEKDYM